MGLDHYEGVHIFAEDGSGHVATLCNEHAGQAGYDLEADNIAPIFASDEMDSYYSCEVRGCEEVFSYVNLTRDGEAWLAQIRSEEA